MSEDGWIVIFPKTKTKQTGAPEYVGVPRVDGDPLCPVAAVEAWFDAASIRVGPVFKTLSTVKGRGENRMRREDISRVLDKLARGAGVDGLFRSHSLRRGVASSAEQLGVARRRTSLFWPRRPKTHYLTAPK